MFIWFSESVRNSGVRRPELKRNQLDQNFYIS